MENEVRNTADTVRELFEKKDFASLRRKLEDMEPADVAALIGKCDTEEALPHYSEGSCSGHIRRNGSRYAALVYRKIHR